MKYVCLGYLEEGKFESFSEEELHRVVDECLSYTDELKSAGHYLSEESLEGPRSAATLRYQGGRVVVSDGPYAETKELLGGILVFEADDLNHAIQLMSKHPGLRLCGSMEIRPAFDMTGMIEESNKRRNAA